LKTNVENEEWQNDIENASPSRESVKMKSFVCGCVRRYE
jgi:hypothetical protein